ncbi:autophagy protein atg9 [Batrachochytrium dendrobatidis]|nr:autophagy protein atg9 [Batrachochytrium dendrobatidis]KAK5671425.1 autophagy protein atg9 [Batrachochytrium dendrobatidis]
MDMDMDSNGETSRGTSHTDGRQDNLLPQASLHVSSSHTMNMLPFQQPNTIASDRTAAPFHYTTHSTYQPPVIDSSDEGESSDMSPSASITGHHAATNISKVDPSSLDIKTPNRLLPLTANDHVISEMAEPIDSRNNSGNESALSAPPFAFEQSAIPSTPFLPINCNIHTEPLQLDGIGDEQDIQLRFDPRIIRQPSYTGSNISPSHQLHQQLPLPPQYIFQLQHRQSQQSSTGFGGGYATYAQQPSHNFNLLQQPHILENDNQHYVHNGTMQNFADYDYNEDSDSNGEASPSIQFEACPSEGSIGDLESGAGQSESARLLTNGRYSDVNRTVDHHGKIDAQSTNLERPPLPHRNNQQLSDFPRRPVFGMRTRDQRILSNSTRDPYRMPAANPSIRSQGNGEGGHTSYRTAPSGQRASGSSRGITSWKDVHNLDAFLTRIYEYYCGKGYFCMSLVDLTSIASLAFIIFTSTFLLSCVKYELIHEKKRLLDVVDSDCIGSMSWPTSTILLVFILWWVFQVFRFFTSLPRLREMQAFYTTILEISDDKLQNTLWSDVVDRIIQTRDLYGRSNPTAVLRKLDAHDIANRILRKDNYIIAMINKNVLNLSVPLFGKRQIMSKLIEWNLQWCIFELVFDSKGQIRKEYLRESQRSRLIERMQKQFRKMAILNLLLSPFLLIFLVIYSLFKYAEEYQRNSSALSARQYSPFAMWKFREFNELPHLLRTRLFRSTESANTYIRQFPHYPLVIVVKFISFVSGSLGAILLALTLFEEEMQQGFEISPGRSAFFYIGLCGTIMAISRSIVPPETEVYDPEQWMREVAAETHYLPDTWRSHAHTSQVRSEFCELYDYKLVLWMFELLSVLVAPFVLYYSLPGCAGEIVDFFRAFTIKSDRLGYVCSFAVFDFKRHGDVRFGAPALGNQVPEAYDGRLVSNQGKMEMSFLNFKANHPHWEPDVDGEEYLSRLLAHRRDRIIGSGGLRPNHLGSGAASYQGSMMGQSRFAQPMGGTVNGLPSPYRHELMTSTMMESPGLNGDGRYGSGMMESYLRGESMIQTTQLNAGRVGRELLGILDAIHEAHHYMM